MPEQIRFFEKNIIDYENQDTTITVTDAVADDTGQTWVNVIRDRKNDSAWATTGSDDSANTTLVVDWVDGRDVDSIVLVKHNFKTYTIKYWDGSAWQDFSTPINVADSAIVGDFDTTIHEFNKIEISRIQIIIAATKVLNDDKRMFQLLVTENIGDGQLNGYPIINNPIVSTNKKISRMLSGKVSIADAIGAFSCSLNVASWRDAADLTIVESVYFKRRGCLLWLCGGDEAQFSTRRIGYRKEDFYLVRTVNEYSPEWRDGFYWSGLNIQVDFVEAVD